MTIDDSAAHRGSQHADLEFAEEYTVAERGRRVIGGLAAGLAVIAIGKLWLFPWLTHFAASAPCRTVSGVNGATVLWWGLFVGIPLTSAALVVATMGRRGVRILRDGQVPPRREKVLRPTRIRRGRQARLIGYLHVLAWSPFLALALWGGFQAAALQQQGLRSGTSCPAHGGPSG
jgi:hypothetical protein